MPWLSLLSLAAAHATVMERDLLDTPDLRWQTLHDTVMGGVSSGGVETSDDGLRFTGTLSLDNNGGFASVRGLSERFDLDGTAGVQLEVLGDGRTWQVTIERDDVRLRAGSYRTAIETKAGTATVHTLRWSDFEATSFGRPVVGVPPLTSAPERISRIGLLVADKTPGPFAIELRSLRPLALEDDAPAAPTGADPTPSVARTFARAIELGVPAFNRGKADICRAHYQTAIESVLLLGAPGLSPPEVARLEDALSAAADQPATEAAWTLRRAMDGVLAARTQ